MAVLAGVKSSADEAIAFLRLETLGGTDQAGATQLDRLHAFLESGAPEHVLLLLAAARARAAQIASAGGGNSASETVAAQEYAADVLAHLAAEGELDPIDTRIAARALGETTATPYAATYIGLFLRTVSSPVLLELPPVVAAEIQLRLLLHLDVAAEVSLWRRAEDGDIECLISLGADPTDRKVRNAAKAAITGRARISLVARSDLGSAAVHRFGSPDAAVVALPHGDHGRHIRAYLDGVASALAPVLERELLLERNIKGERALTGAAESRLTRLCFDLHDGPIQDVLVFGTELRELRDQVYPFVLDSHRELTAGRFDDLLARVVELDRQLRETAHSLESRSIVSRPLAEILHREVEGFTHRTGIEASASVRGDPETLSGQQRIALFRAIQESLSNIREHSGATTATVHLHVRRSTVDVRVIDDGRGFEVSQVLQDAAERGRLGIVGIAERVRMLGGSFNVESRTGGPTTVRFSLPRWEPFAAVTGKQG
ncbi:MAG: ATP-binding protein [Thermoleophilia bacterium]